MEGWFNYPGPRYTLVIVSILAGRQAGRVCISGPDGQAMGLSDGSSAPHARGPFWFGLRRGILAGRQAGRVCI